MADQGAGSGRIVLVGAPSNPEFEELPPSDWRPPVRAERPARVHPLARRPMQTNGWTIRRLTTAAAFGAGALGVGALLFVARFGSGDGAGGPLLAAGFGLFVIGMVVFCAALIALLGSGIGRLATRHGWPRAAALALGPPAFAWGLLGLGIVGFAIPAVLSLILISGFVVALR